MEYIDEQCTRSVLNHYLGVLIPDFSEFSGYVPWYSVGTWSVASALLSGDEEPALGLGGAP